MASCPSGSIYKREEDGIVLIDQDKCRGWRMCVSGCPYKKIYYNWQTGKAEKCIFCYPRIEAGQPTVCSETCVGRIRYLGVLLYDADQIQAASVEHDRDLYQAQLNLFLDPNDPKVIEQARKDGIPEALAQRRQEQPGLQDGGGLEGGAAPAPGVPHPAHGLVCATAVAHSVGGASPVTSVPMARSPDVNQLRIPVKYLANLLTAGDTIPVTRALERMLAMRGYMRGKHVDGVENQKVLAETGGPGQAHGRRHVPRDGHLRTTKTAS